MKIKRQNLKVLVLHVIIILFSTSIFGQKNDYLITSFGAVADGITNNAQAIQNAINAAHKNGGGKVIVPAGNFVTGSIILKSRVNLYIDLGARLLGSDKISEYGNSISLALIVAKGQSDIGISGQGVIDGQASDLIKNIFIQLQGGKLDDKQWRFKRPTETVRPKLVEIIECDSVDVRDVKMTNSAAWVSNYSKCSNLVIDNVTIQSTAYYNNDGIDISDCKNVRITNCDVNSADDGICLKSEANCSGNENIYIADCKIRSSANAFKLGTSSHGGFKNITVRNLEIYDTYRSAIALESVDGGILEDIDIQGINAKNTGNAIFIRLGHRNKDGEPGELRNILIADVKVEIPLRKPDLGYPLEGPPDYLRFKYTTQNNNRPDLGYPYNGLPSWPYNLIPSSITGLPGHSVENVHLENIEIIFEGGSDKNLAYIELDSLQKVAEMPDMYPEFSQFGELPAWGVFVRHVDGISFKNVKLSYKKFDFRPSLIFDDVKNIKLDGVEILSGEELPIIMLNDVEGTDFKNLKLPFKEEKAILIKK